MRALSCYGLLSVVVALSLCKSAAADDTAGGFLDGFKLGGYSSAYLNVHPGGKSEASLEEVSFLLRWEGEGRWRFFAELEQEKPVSWKSGQGLTNDGARIDLERFYLDYNISEQYNLRAGRFLTPAGRWNLIHAAPLVWTTTRPLATSRLFPQSTNGIMLYGAKSFDNRAFEYTFFMEALEDQHLDGDEIQYRDTHGARFAFTGKLNLGLTLMEFTEDIPGTPQFRMMGADFMVKHDDWEFSGEAYQRYYSNNRDGGSGGYLQAVAPLGNRWFAVGRLENFKRPAEGSAERWVVGTAWRLQPNRVFKLEYVGGDEERADAPKGLFTSFAILF